MNKLGIGCLRVSTDKQFYTGDSIDVQQARTDAAAEKDGVKIVHYVTEHFSGRKTDRLAMQEMIAFLDANPAVTYVYIPTIDRLTRAGSETYLNLQRQLYERGVHLRDVYGIIQKPINTLADLDIEYDWSVRTPSRTAEIIQAEYANAEVSDILTRTIGQQIRLARQGYQTRSADFGYRNEKITRENGRKATIMLPHEPEATWIRTMFELRAEGSWSDDAICDRLNRMGYKSRSMNRYDKATGEVIGETGGKPLIVKQLQRYISRPVYCGIRTGKWIAGPAIATPFDGLVSIALYNRANRGAWKVSVAKNGEVSVVRGEERLRNSKASEDFLLRHVAHCPQCGKPFHASRSKGKRGDYFGYYHCSRSHKYLGIKKKEFEETVGSYLDSLQLKPGFLPLFKEVVRDVWIRKNRFAMEEAKSVEGHAKTLELKQEDILKTLQRTSSEVVSAKLEKQVEELEAQINATRKQGDGQTISEDQIAKFFEIAKFILEHPRQTVENASTKSLLHKVWRRIFVTNPSWQDFEFRTPELTLLYRLNDTFEEDERLMAGVLGLNWNTFESEAIAAVEAFSDHFTKP